MAVAIADSSQFSTAVPSRTGGTATLTRTHSVGIAVIFFHWDGTNAVSGVTFDGSAATVLSVSSGTNPSQCMAYAPCSSSGTHTWVLTVSGTCPTTQGLSATMTGAANTASQTATRSWQNLAPVSLGTLTINTNGLGVVMGPILPTGGTWTNATQVFSSDGVFRIATVSTTGATSHSSGGSGAGVGALVFDDASASGNNITGSTSLLFTPSATLLGTGAVTGSSTLTFAPSATLLGTGAVSGTSALTFAPSGTLLGKGAIVGSSTITFSASLTPPGSTGISGTAALTFTPSATLLGTGQIAGSASITFTLSGGITLPVTNNPTAISTTVRFSPGNVRQSWGSASNRSGFRPGRIPRN